MTPTNRTRTHKVRQAAKYPKIKIVNLQWLLDSISKWERQDEAPYLVGYKGARCRLVDTYSNQVEILSQDRRHDGPPSVPSSLYASDEDDDDSGSEDEPEPVAASQEEEIDSDGLIPDAPEGHSPIDDLKTFDWGQADDELAEYLDDLDSGDDSDTSSVTSDSSRFSKQSSHGTKRIHVTDDEDSDDGSATAKKQRISNSRTTGLKTVKTPNSEDSESTLPTPGPTDEQEGAGAGADGWGEAGDESEDDLEAEMMREFEREEQEADDGAG